MHKTHYTHTHTNTHTHTAAAAALSIPNQEDMLKNDNRKFVDVINIITKLIYI
jgi:hypothetical protein